ncbi:MAG: toll/interleukin-1 receptor domain-containing protein [Lachnospiraceae bacterium]|nr:toll/interleukin-1 receptor domain-containing protein [Lachnospiraceae bacterium]
MAVLRCTICGGDLDLNTDRTVGVCQYCGSTITIPKNLDRIGNLYNRASFLRQNNEFYQAVAVYEEILREDNTDAEAHWGLILSRYGIEYVKDAASGKRIPTCHRMQNTSILADPDYKAAIQYADVEARAVYEEQAEEIARVQKRILEISKREEAFDIFICYKETDSDGERTEDSVIAQDIYMALEKEGYEVFFARKTLESKLGTEYEPIIFNALCSAKVMLVIGTNPEHFTATWVRNEWSRYIAMNENGDKTIIPLYKEMSPYELPIELSNVQGLDMSKIGFLQELMDGIKRLLCKKSHNTDKVVREDTNVYNSAMSLEKLLKNAETYQRLENIGKADEIYKKVTEEYPEDYRGWWGRIVCATNNFTDLFEREIQSWDFPWEKDVEIWYRYVNRVATSEKMEELKKIYEAYMRNIAEHMAEIEISEINGVLQKNIDIVSKVSEESKRLKSEREQQLASHDANVELYRNRKMEAEKIHFLSVGGIGAIICTIITGFIFIGSIGSMLDGGMGIAIGIVGLFIDLFPGTLAFAGWNILLSNRKEALIEVEEQKISEQSIFQKEIASISDSIKKLEEDIKEGETVIRKCRDYLDLGNEDIKNHWVNKICSRTFEKAEKDKILNSDEYVQAELLRRDVYSVLKQK